MDWRQKLVTITAIMVTMVALSMLTLDRVKAQSGPGPVTQASTTITVVVSPANLTIDASTCLTSAVALAPYSCSVVVKGGTPPYKDSIGNLANPWPPGVNIVPNPNGTGFDISGAFQAPGTTPLAIRVCDSTNATCPAP